MNYSVAAATKSYSAAANALRQYQQVKTGAALETASPHRLVQMLFEGALDRLASAKGYIQRGNSARKGEQISKAIGIIGGLREGLDRNNGGDLVDNLDALYDYMEQRLFQANLTSDSALIEEVSELLTELKDAWDAIGDTAN